MRVLSSRDFPVTEFFIYWNLVSTLFFFAIEAKASKCTQAGNDRKCLIVKSSFLGLMEILTAAIFRKQIFFL